MDENERNRILSMLKDGKISVEEAQQLLDALDGQNRKIEEPVALKDTRGRKSKKLKVIVDAGSKDKEDAKVNVNIPLSLIRTVGPIIAKNMPKSAKEKLDENGVDLEQIFKDVENLTENGLDEDIVNIDVGEDGDRAKVRVYVE